MSKLLKTFQELDGGTERMAGGKGAALARLFQAGFPVPDGFVILPEAFEGDDLKPEAWQQVLAQVKNLRAGQGQAALAVRSSALSEDSAQASFAGEFESVLNVRSDEELCMAIMRVYHSRDNERVQAYSQARGFEGDQHIGVVVQLLVPAEASGVMFTANPLTGRRDQALISAAWGLGEAIVGGLVTPDTLVVHKDSQRVLERQTADKQVMTVLHAQGTAEQPTPQKKRLAPVLSNPRAAELAALGVEIEKRFGLPVDIEWALADDKLYILQARPVTALPEPEPEPPKEWKFKGMAVRNNIVEMMTDPLTPLFRTMGLQAINTSLGNLMATFFGRKGVMPDEMIVTVNQYAYYSGRMKPSQIGFLLWNSVGIAKRMFTGAVERWTEQGRPRYIAVVEEQAQQPWREAGPSEILQGARRMAEAAIDAYGALVGGLIPAAWISEALFTSVYKLLVKRRDDPDAPVYLMGFDSLPILAEKALYDLAQSCRTKPQLADYLSQAAVESLAAALEQDDARQGVQAGEWLAWREGFLSHLGRYGYMIYNLDFGNPTPADDPRPQLQTFQMYLRGQGVNPHERQQAAAERRAQAVEAVQARLKGWRLKLFNRWLAAAQRYAPLRENGLAEVGLSYPLLRQMLLELGRRFAEQGMIAQAQDIFWLEQAEVEDAARRLARGDILSDLSALVPQRQAAWRAAGRAAPPRMLPHMKLFERDPHAQRGATLKGVAASPGKVTARACVLHSPAEFERMHTGDVLVASLTTPAWTPLFARAAAIVTDIGGPLSHGSIVAREYGIPAVLGAGTATARIRDGQMVTVDGGAGKVILER